MTSRTDERVPLNRDSITDAAMRLIDADGLDALSMRKLGTALGYEAMALYKHVADKQAVIDATVAAAFDEMTLPDPADSWAARLRHSATQLRKCALRHPHLLIPMTTDPPATPAVIERIDAVLAALRDSGASERDVVRHFWLFVNLTTGALIAEARALATSQQSVAPALDEDALERIAECRAMREFGPALAACDFESEYDHAVRTLISLVESVLSPA